jgi:hypothetical protein
MAKTKIKNNDIQFIYRADCLDCGKLVGPKRTDRNEAVADIAVHKSKPGNADHDVKIEKTQKF